MPFKAIIYEALRNDTLSWFEPWHLVCHWQCGQTAITTFFKTKDGARPRVSATKSGSDDSEATLWLTSGTCTDELKLFLQIGKGRFDFFIHISQTDDKTVSQQTLSSRHHYNLKSSLRIVSFFLLVFETSSYDKHSSDSRLLPFAESQKCFFCSQETANKTIPNDSR